MDNLRPQLEKLEKLNNERQDKFFAWLRNIITISAGLIAVLVSLKSKKSVDDITHFFFCLTISLFSIGILTGCGVLYHEVFLLDKSQDRLHKYILELSRNSEADDLTEYVDNHKFYKLTLIICLSCYILGLISLTIYAFLIDK